MKRARVMLAVVALTIAGMAIVPSAQAYEYLACHWGTTKPTYNVVVNNSPTTSFDTAANRWNDRQSAVTLTKTSSSTHDIRVYNTRMLDYEWTGVVSARGDLTRMAGCSNGHWGRGALQLVVNTRYNSTSSERRTGTATHEFGHALGLAHNNATVSCPGGGRDYLSIMHYSTEKYYGNCARFHPSGTDINAIKARY